MVDLGFMMQRPKVKEKMTLGGSFQNHSSVSSRLLKMDPFFLGMHFHFFLFFFFFFGKRCHAFPGEIAWFWEGMGNSLAHALSSFWERGVSIISWLSCFGLPRSLYKISEVKVGCQLDLWNFRVEGSLSAWTVQFYRARLVVLKDCTVL